MKATRGTRRWVVVGLALVMLGSSAGLARSEESLEDWESPALQHFSQGRSTGYSQIVDTASYIPFEDHERWLATFTKYQLAPLVVKGIGGMPLLWGDLVGYGSGNVTAVSIPRQCVCMAEALYPQTPHEKDSELSGGGGDPKTAAFRAMHASATAAKEPTATASSAFTGITVADGAIRIDAGSSASRSAHRDGVLETGTATVLKDVTIGPLRIELLESSSEASTNGTADAAQATALTRITGATVNDVPVTITGEGVRVGEQEGTVEQVAAAQEQVNQALAGYGIRVSLPRSSVSVEQGGQVVSASTPGFLVHFYPDEQQDALQAAVPVKGGLELSIGGSSARTEAYPRVKTDETDGDAALPPLVEDPFAPPGDEPVARSASVADAGSAGATSPPELASSAFLGSPGGTSVAGDGYSGYANPAIVSDVTSPSTGLSESAARTASVSRPQGSAGGLAREAALAAFALDDRSAAKFADFYVGALLLAMVALLAGTAARAYRPMFSDVREPSGSREG